MHGIAIKPVGQQGRRGHGAHFGAQAGQQLEIGTGNAAVQDIAADRHAQTGDASLAAADGERVEQRLGRVFVAAIAGIQHRAIDLLRNKLHRARRSVADHDHVRVHGVQRQRGIQQGLALLKAGAGDAEIDHVCPQPLAGDFEAEQRAGGVLEKGVDLGKAGETIIPLGRTGAVHVHPLFGFIQQERDFPRLQLGDTEQMFMRERMRAACKSRMGGGARHGAHP